MKCNIVYLKPYGAGGFKPDLRSDTLWSAICWAIRLVHGEDRLKEVLSAYGNANSDNAFYISSAFTYEETPEGKLHFFPAPLKPFRQLEPLSFSDDGPIAIKLAAREDKKRQKLAGMISKPHLEYIIGGGQEEIPAVSAPQIINRPMTHNTIDRLTGSTIDLNNSGQLFHTNEQYVKGKNSGLYFLVSGNVDTIKPALRFLENEGIGGDRSTGKGRFIIDGPNDFEIATPAEPNALLCLSLFRPADAELAHWTGSKDRLLNFATEDRRGRIYFQGNDTFLHESSITAFKEGSVFPAITGRDIYGQNCITGRHNAGFDMYRYGYGFMVPAKIL